ncbi:four helix bundle protein [Elusimicrobiota bacterium]
MYKSFEDMQIWKDSMSLAEEIFGLTDNLPKKEDYGFTSQIRRSVLSISSNIAEGFGRNYTNDKLNFYYYARGSLMETLNHIEYAKRVGYLDREISIMLKGKLKNIHAELNKLTISLRKNSQS